MDSILRSVEQYQSLSETNKERCKDLSITLCPGVRREYLQVVTAASDSNGKTWVASVMRMNEQIFNEGRFEVVVNEMRTFEHCLDGKSPTFWIDIEERRAMVIQHLLFTLENRLFKRLSSHKQLLKEDGKQTPSNVCTPSTSRTSYRW